mmetsp:Transcript_6193/g.10234  ORF Transcript_6193/g.10234 Transcript_6193/m.10234 type:complete len:118 (-) Transcript_6193:370-723(-)
MDKEESLCCHCIYGPHQSSEKDIFRINKWSSLCIKPINNYFMMSNAKVNNWGCHLFWDENNKTWTQSGTAMGGVTRSSSTSIGGGPSLPEMWTTQRCVISIQSRLAHMLIPAFFKDI